MDKHPDYTKPHNERTHHNARTHHDDRTHHDERTHHYDRTHHDKITHHDTERQGPLKETRVSLQSPHSAQHPRVTLDTPDPPLASASEFDIEQNRPLEGESSLSGYLMKNEDLQKFLCCGGLVVVIVAILTTVILSLSFRRLEYYEYGFGQGRTSGKVDINTVYMAGIHTVGPDTILKPFPADAHFVSFHKVTVFTSDKLQVIISARFQYFLRPHQLAMLHEKYDLQYEEVLRNNALDAMKDRATLFSTREYIRERMRIEKEFYAAIRDRLGGACCEKDCVNTDNCVPSCKPYDSCLEEDFGHFAEVRYFQLAAMNIPRDLAERYLQALVLIDENDAEKLIQEGQVVRKETESRVKDLENKAEELRQNADSQSSLIMSKAEAHGSSVIGRARTDGLKHLYSEIGLNTQEHQASFDYIRTLSNMNNVSMAVDFDQLITGKFLV